MQTIRAIYNLLNTRAPGENLLTAYMDDVCCATRPEYMNDIVQTAKDEFNKVGLRLNDRKTTIWTRPGVHIPGSQVAQADVPMTRLDKPDAFRIPLTTHDGHEQEASRRVWEALETRRSCALVKLEALEQNGLGTQQAFALLKTLAPADVTFHMRVLDAPAGTLERMDNQASETARRPRAAPFGPSRLCWSRLPLREGGLGLPNTATTATAARLASIANALPVIANNAKLNILNELKNAAPQMAQTVPWFD